MSRSQIANLKTLAVKCAYAIAQSARRPLRPAFGEDDVRAGDRAVADRGATNELAGRVLSVESESPVSRPKRASD